MISFASYNTLLALNLFRKNICLGRYSAVPQRFGLGSGGLDRREVQRWFVVVREFAPQQKAGEKGAADEFVLTRSGLLF
jgi:hypothetical protein